MNRTIATNYYINQQTKANAKPIKNLLNVRKIMFGHNKIRIVKIQLNKLYLQSYIIKKRVTIKIKIARNYKESKKCK